MVGLFCLPALAQFTGDATAQTKIDDAINNHYLMMKLDKAESVLNETISGCGDNCSPAIKAKAWMYIGLVRGSGKNDQNGAGAAFAKAKALDPSVRLDSELATPETQATFDGTSGGGGSAPAPAASRPAAASAGASRPPGGVPGDMTCSPQGTSIQTGVPIPFSCTSDADVAAGFIKFLEPGGSDWKKITLMEIDGQWQAEIPCKFTTDEGELKFYIGMKDPSGEYVDQFGSKKIPASIFIENGGTIPAFPGQPPVERCGGASAGAAAAGSEDCPPDFPGCSSSSDSRTCGELEWGAACGNSTQCKCGLLCEEGQCATAPTCSTDADCGENSCVDGYCSALAPGGDEGGAGPYKKHWFSLTAGMDLMPLSGTNLCSSTTGYDQSYGIQCYDALNQRVYVEGASIGQGGVTPGQLRVKLGYDYALMEHFSVGARVGMAFMNTHPTTIGEPAFLPLHLEARGTYHFTSLAKKGLRPSLYAALGFGEANGKLVANTTQIYKVAGRIFAAPGGSLAYMFAPNMGISADVQLMLLFPAGGLAIAIHPALSFTYGL